MRHRLACDPPFVKNEARKTYERLHAWAAAFVRLGLSRPTTGYLESVVELLPLGAHRERARAIRNGVPSPTRGYEPGTILETNRPR